MQLTACGQMAAFAGDFEPRGWMTCDGRALPIARYDCLYRVIGKSYGGDDRTFNIPKRKGPAEGMAAIICVQGMSPPPEPRPWEPDILGFAVEWKDARLPKGTLKPAGQILQITDHMELYTIVENKFGGDQLSATFGLPKLAGDWIFVVSGSFPARG